MSCATLDWGIHEDAIEIKHNRFAIKLLDKFTRMTGKA